MIQQVVFSASTDEARPVLTGVLVEVEGNKITFASADGFRLSIRSAELSTEIRSPISVIIPARALSELARVATDGNQNVTMLLPPGRGASSFFG
ncbi:MAG: hypothetical protein HC806_01620 [Anaerolineae bacterium]|nr:hypothetical protein [Anaerolineae bacterium]